MGDAFEAALDAGLAELGLTGGPADTPLARRTYEAHARLLRDWNAAINLTAIREADAIALRHVCDSLSAVACLSDVASPGSSLLDIGSGGGYPGLPLAAALPLGRLGLLDSVGKKARFLGVAAAAVSQILATERDPTPSIEAFAERAEDLAEEPDQRGTWDIVVTRAVGSLAEVIELSLPLTREGGTMVAWKREEERDGLGTELPPGRFDHPRHGRRSACGDPHRCTITGGSPVGRDPEGAAHASRLSTTGLHPQAAQAIGPRRSRRAPSLAPPQALLGSRRCSSRSSRTSTPTCLRSKPSSNSIGPYDQLWVLGDSVGYGPDPDAVVERLRAENAVAVQGNHDAAVLGRIPTGTFNDLARAAVEWTAGTMAPANLAWLAEQPEKRETGDFTMVHGSPRDPLWEYLFSVPSARLNLAAFETPYCLVGHTHQQLTFRDDRGQVEALLAGDGSELVLDERRCILNPGSVGQPRDGDPRACAMTIDTESGRVSWSRVEYPVDATQEAIRALPLPERLAERLESGV